MVTDRVLDPFRFDVARRIIGANKDQVYTCSTLCFAVPALVAQLVARWSAELTLNHNQRINGTRSLTLFEKLEKFKETSYPQMFPTFPEY